MIVVPDANILLRIVEKTSGQHAIALAAVSALRLRGHTLRTVPQCFYEFWTVGTRPVANNGLGLSTVEVDQEVAKHLSFFPLLNDTPALFSEWRSLVLAHDCKGKVAHDARMVAAMRTHGLAHILTFNVNDFVRFPGITVLNPSAVSAATP